MIKLTKNIKWAKKFLLAQYKKREPLENSSEKEKIIYQREIQQVIKNCLDTKIRK